MADAEDGGNSKHRCDAEEAVYDGDTRFSIVGKDVIDMNHAGQMEQTKNVGVNGRCCTEKEAGMVRFDEDTRNIGDIRDIIINCGRPN